MKMTLAAQLYQIIHNSGYGNQHDKHVRLKTFQQHVSKFQKLFEYCNENTKNVHKYTNRKCCLDVRSVRGVVTRGGEQRDSSQLASSPPTRRLSPPPPGCALLLWSLMCLAAGDFATVRSESHLNAVFTFISENTNFPPCRLLRGVHRIASLSSAEFMVSDSLAVAVLLKTQK